MKITDAKVIVCSPGRNFVSLKITTEDGIYGLGDATLNGRELAVVSYLSDHVLPLLIGRDARRIEAPAAGTRAAEGLPTGAAGLRLGRTSMSKERT